MNATSVYANPYDHRWQHVGRECPHTLGTQRENESDSKASNQQPRHGNSGRVAARDHDNCAKVVDHCQSQQQDSERGRDSLAEQCQHSDRKGDVRRHRNPPARMDARLIHQHQINQCRYDHAAQRSYGRQGSSSPLRQLTVVQFPADLQTNDEEEDRHQYVVDEPLERALEHQRPDVDADGCLPQRGVAALPG